MEEIRDFNQLKMLKAFADTQMSSTDMLGTTGYGLWDTGRAKLEQIFAEVMGAEDTRAQPVPERHPHAGCGAVRPAAGRGHPAGRHRPPLRYAGRRDWSGRQGQGHRHPLMDYGIRYDEAPLKADFTPDYDLIAQRPPVQRCATSSAAAAICSAMPLIWKRSEKLRIPPAPQTRTSLFLWITATASSPRRRNPVRWAQTLWWAA